MIILPKRDIFECLIKEACRQNKPIFHCLPRNPTYNVAEAAHEKRTKTLASLVVTVEMNC